jgi:predicted RNase H-like nuclease (RuvC/YqgF family)
MVRTGDARAMNAADAVTVVRTQVEDLRAEVEAEARAVERMRTEACQIATLLRSRSRETVQMGALLRRIDELRACVRQQRSTTRQLRQSVAVVRLKVSSLVKKLER